MPHLRRLQYFVIVAEELNFQRAADRINITQPALWRQIRELEQESDVRLFTRETSGIKLTDAGSGFLADVRRILDQLAEARKRAHRIHLGQVGVVRIAFNEIAARQRCLPHYFQAFRASFPEIELQLSVMMSQRQIEALDRREIDAGFLFHRPSPMQDCATGPSSRMTIWWRCQRDIPWRAGRRSPLRTWPAKR